MPTFRTRRLAAPALALAGLSLASLLVLAAGPATGEDALPYPKGDSQQEHGGIHFDLRLPKSFDGRKPHGLILVMPGGIGTLDALGDAPYVLMHPFVPTARASGMWSAAETKKISAAVEHVRKTLGIAKTRVHAIAMERTSVHSIFEMVVYKKTSPFVSVCYVKSSNARYNVASSLKKRLRVLAYDHDVKPADGMHMRKIEEELAGKVRTVEFVTKQDDPVGTAYFRYWHDVAGGLFTPGVDHSFVWTSELKDVDALQASLAKRELGGMVYLFHPKNDAESREAKALQHDTFFDPRVRTRGRNVLRWKVDASASAAIMTALGCKKTPAVVVFNKEGKLIKRFEGKVKASSLASALKKAGG